MVEKNGVPTSLPGRGPGDDVRPAAGAVGADAPSPGPEHNRRPGGGGLRRARRAVAGRSWRSAFIVGILALVFGVILPVDRLRRGPGRVPQLDFGQAALMTALGAVAWLVSGFVLSALVDGLSGFAGRCRGHPLRDRLEHPVRSWNMGVLWMAMRSWA